MSATVEGGRGKTNHQPKQKTYPGCDEETQGEKTKMTTQNSAQQFMAEMAEYTGDNFFQEVAYGFEINDEATDAAWGGADSTAIVFMDGSSVTYSLMSKEWSGSEDLNDSVFAFQIIDGVTRSETMYVRANQFKQPDESSLMEICEEYARKYDKNGDEGWMVCHIDGNLDENEYELQNEYKFAFDGSDDFEWETSREYVTY